MAKGPFQETVSRRKMLQVLAGSAGSVVGVPLVHGVETGRSHTHALMQIADQTAPYLPKFFTAPQMHMLADLTEIIIPTDAHSPGAKAARVDEYIDAVVADSLPENKELWTKGLVAVDELAKRDYGKALLQCLPDQQLALIEKISKNEEHPQTLEERFFKALKNATVNGYYTSAIGIHQDLQYVGNTYLDAFPGCTHPEHQGKPEG